MLEDQVKLPESAWRRGWTDTKRDLVDWRFLLTEVGGGGLLSVYYQNALPGFAFALGFALFLWIWATATAPIRQRDELRKFIDALQSIPSLSIIFPQEANAPATISPFRQVTTFRLSGTPLAAPHPQHHKFYIGITNNTTRTIKNVSVRVVSANMPERPMDLHLLAKKNDRPEVDIAPKITELFRLGSVMRREEDDIIGDTNVVDAPTLASVAEMAERHTKYFIGLIIANTKSKEALLRNDGQLLRVVAYGEDVEPAVAEVTLNMKHEISVFVRPVASGVD